MRIRAQLGRLAVLAVALLAASCASPHTNLTAARNDCTAVGRLLGAPPGDQAAWIKEIVSARQSNISSLDPAMHDLARALDSHNTSVSNHAFDEVITACARLKLWHVYH